MFEVAHPIGESYFGRISKNKIAKFLKDVVLRPDSRAKLANYENISSMLSGKPVAWEPNTKEEKKPSAQRYYYYSVKKGDKIYHLNIKENLVQEENNMNQITTKIPVPHGLTDEEWAMHIKELEWIRTEEAKANATAPNH